MTQDKQALRATLAALDPGDDASSYAELSRVLRSTAESLKTDIDRLRLYRPPEVLLARQLSPMLSLDDGTKLEIHAVASAPIPNWTVENVEAPRRVFDTKKVRTVATVAGYNTPEATRKVTLLANGKPLETKEIKVPANGRATVEFLALDAPYGLTRCEVRIDSADTFPEDDHWLFSVERADPKPALLVHADTDSHSPLYRQDGARIIFRAGLQSGFGRCQSVGQRERLRNTRSSSFPIPDRYPNASMTR